MSATVTASKPRVRKSPADKATEALNLAQARHDRAERNLKAAESALEGAKAEHAQAAKFLGYAQQHPDLPVQAEVAASDG